MSLLREPLLHFLVAGLALFAIDRARTAAPRRIVVDEAALRERFTRARGRPPSAAELEEAVARWIDDEVLYREGLARGLDRDDPGVRTRVAALMAYVLEKQVPEPAPGPAELRAWFEQHRDAFAEPERLDFTHVFVAGDGPAAEQRAAALLAELRAGADPDRLGDRFPGGRRYRGRKPADLAEAFGEPFAAGLTGQPPGTWTLARSRHGLHLVRVDRHTPGRPAELAAVEADVRKAWQDARRAEAVAQAVARLRGRWEIVRP